MYSQTILDEIKDRVSIVALVGERVPLKKAGRNFKGNCPFHSEKTPSFMVNDDKKIYHCFGCGEGGNVFNFFMKYDGLSFQEAVEMLAGRASVHLPKQRPIDKKQEDIADKRKKWAYRLNQIVAEYFCENLKDEQKGMAARNYLKSRDIFLEKNTQHFLGYADDSWDALVRYLTSKSVPLDLAAEIGVIKKREGGGYYDFFRHRVIFPVITPCYAGAPGKVVAFSGRTFGSPKTSEGREAPAKYLNSPDSVIYHKSHNIYGLNVEAIRRADQVILVEGNLDVVRLHQEGIENVTAPLGTALTSGHIRLLARYSKNFFVVFDGDEAGQKAAMRSLPLFLEANIIPRMVVLPKEEDPDSFVRTNGADGFKKIIEMSGTLFEWVIDSTIAKFGTGTDGKVKAVEELKPLFKLVANPVELAIYKKRVASKLSLEESILSSSFKRAESGRREDKTPVRNKPVENMLVELMLQYPETVAMFKKNISIGQFQDGACQTIAKLVFDEFDRAGKLDVDVLTANIADEELKSEILSFAMAENKYDDPNQAGIDCIRWIEKMSAKRRLAELSSQIQKAENDEKLVEYMNEIQQITKQLHNLDKRENHEPC